MKETLGRYKIIKEIGRGAMGTVYQGYDPKIDRIVALKTIRKDRLAESREVEDLVTRFQKEVRAAGKLVHPNIIIIYDTGEDEETAYIAMEHIEGDTLENMIQKGIRFPLEKIVDIIDQTCDGLEYTHRQGIVHRDLKPSNIMLIKGERVKITDFGISKAVGAASSPLTQAGILLGTPSYMSPEQIAGKEIDGRSDLFSLGIILYQLLTEERPFVGDTIPTLLYNIVNRDPILPSQVDSGISSLYDAVIAKAMAKNPENRYQTAKDFAEDVKRASRGEALIEGPSIDATMTVGKGVAEEVPPQRKKYGLLAGIGVLVLILVVGAYYWMQRSPRPAEEEGKLVVPVKKFGKVVVNSDPPDAQVFLDGKDLGALTPAVIEKVSAGEKHEIRVVKKGFKPWAEAVEPEDDKSVAVEASLERFLATIVVKSTPSGAAVFLDGKRFKEPTPTVIQGVTAGEKHEIRVSKKGFKPWAEMVEPEDDKSVAVEALLERLLATIVVKSTPSGAAVFLNGKRFKEPTPTVIEGVTAGEKHEIRVSKKGFKPWAETVEFEDDKSVPVEALLERLLATIVVKSTPSGAAVFLDGVKREELTPTVIQGVTAGERHEIRVEKEGFKPWADTVEPEDDKSVAVEASLERLLATIVVKSTPSGAAVFLDDREVPGSTPLELRDISADDVCKIEVRKKGYAAGVQTVTLKPGERREVEVALKPLFGEIRLASDPPGAEVYLNGRGVARKTPTRLSGLSPGKYKVKLKKEGYKVWEEEVVVRASESLDLPGVRLQEAFGKLNLDVSPWAEVYYRGKKLGDTPLARIPFQEGTHKLILRNPILKIEKAITVKIEADKVTRQSVNLTEGIKGKLKIKVTPWAHVYVDGKPKGTTPLEPLELTPGEYIVMVKNEKLAEERSFRVTIKPNEVHSMEVDLLKKE